MSFSNQAFSNSFGEGFDLVAPPATSDKLPVELPAYLHPDFAGKKPTGPVQIDWSNPLSRGVSHYILFQNGGPVDLVTGQRLTVSGGSYWTPDGQFFDGTDGIATLPDVEINSSFTLLTQLNTDNLGSDWGWVISHGLGYATDSFAVRLAQKSVLFVADNLAFGGKGGDGQATITDWHIDHSAKPIAFRQDAGSSTIVVDGAVESTTGNWTVADGTVDDLIMGNSATPHDYYPGAINYVILFNADALSDAQIRALQRDPYLILKPAIPAYYFTAGAAYSSDLTTASFNFTGQDLDVDQVSGQSLSTTSFNFTGQDLQASFNYSYTLTAPAFNFTPQALDVDQVSGQVLSAGSFSFAGQSVDVDQVTVETLGAASFAFTAQDIDAAQTSNLVPYALPRYLHPDFVDPQKRPSPKVVRKADAFEFNPFTDFALIGNKGKLDHNETRTNVGAFPSVVDSKLGVAYYANGSSTRLGTMPALSGTELTFFWAGRPEAIGTDSKLWTQTDGFFGTADGILLKIQSTGTHSTNSNCFSVNIDGAICETIANSVVIGKVHQLVIAWRGGTDIEVWDNGTLIGSGFDSGTPTALASGTNTMQGGDIFGSRYTGTMGAVISLQRAISSGEAKQLSYAPYREIYEPHFDHNFSYPFVTDYSATLSTANFSFSGQDLDVDQVAGVALTAGSFNFTPQSLDLQTDYAYDLTTGNFKFAAQTLTASGFVVQELDAASFNFTQPGLVRTQTTSLELSAASFDFIAQALNRKQPITHEIERVICTFAAEDRRATILAEDRNVILAAEDRAAAPDTEARTLTESGEDC